MGRAPILHPPGSEVSARPSRASSGAQKRMEARICAAVSPGRVLFEGIPATTMSAPCQWAAHPAPRSSPRLHSTSDSLGTARSRTGPRQRSAAARSGSTLFFAAGIVAMPFSGRPPITQIRPLFCVISAAPIPQKIPHDMQKQGRMSRFEFVNVFVSLSGRAARQQPCPLRLLRRHCPGCGSQRLLRCCSHPAGRRPNSSSLFPPLAAVVAVAPKGRGTGVTGRPSFVQPLRHGFAVPPPLVGEALAFRSALPLRQRLPY